MASIQSYSDICILKLEAFQTAFYEPEKAIEMAMKISHKDIKWNAVKGILSSISKAAAKNPNAEQALQKFTWIASIAEKISDPKIQQKVFQKLMERVPAGSELAQYAASKFSGPNEKLSRSIQAKEEVLALLDTCSPDNLHELLQIIINTPLTSFRMWLCCEVASRKFSFIGITTPQQMVTEKSEVFRSLQKEWASIPNEEGLTIDQLRERDIQLKQLVIKAGVYSLPSLIAGIAASINDPVIRDAAIEKTTFILAITYPEIAKVELGSFLQDPNRLERHTEIITLITQSAETGQNQAPVTK